MSFNLWEANVFEQYLEEMAAQGWFLESVGGSVMKFHRAEPAKRRYAALLVPGSSSLTGADSWKAEQFRKQCQEAGWNFECSGTFWQIFYTTDDAVERTGDMTEEKQFLIQKSLSWTWSVKLCYPVLIVLEAWAVYRYLQNPGKLFSDSMLLLLNLLMVGIFVSWIVSYVRIFWWVYKTTSAFKKGEPLPKMDLRRKVNFKKRIILFDGILILGGLAFSSSMSAFVGFMISSVLIVAISFFMRNWIRNNGSGDNRDDWIGYLVGVAVVCMITIPLCNAATSHFLGEEEPDADKKQTIFASCQNDEFKINGSGTPVGVTIYKSPIPWIIRKTSECYPKDMSDLWDQTEQKQILAIKALCSWAKIICQICDSKFHLQSSRKTVNGIPPRSAVFGDISKSRHITILLIQPSLGQIDHSITRIVAMNRNAILHKRFFANLFQIGDLYLRYIICLVAIFIIDLNIGFYKVECTFFLRRCVISCYFYIFCSIFSSKCRNSNCLEHN